jgi:hypothetical protein
MRWLATFCIFVGALIFAGYFWAAIRHGLVLTATNGLVRKDLNANPLDYWSTILVSALGAILLFCAGIWLASTE